MPAPIANVDFEAINASSTGSRRASPTASRMSASGRMRVRATAWSRAACIGRRTSEITTAASTNDTAFAMNAASRPNTPAYTPPSAAPIASIAPHSEPNSTAALANSSGERVRLGSEAWADGPTNDPRAEIAHRHTYPIHTVAHGVDQQQAERGDRLHDRDRSDDPLAVEPVGGGPGDRRHEERRQGLRDVDERDQDRAIADVLHDADECDVHEPVTGVRDDLREEQAADVAVRSQQLPHAAPVLAHTDVAAITPGTDLVREAAPRAQPAGRPALRDHRHAGRTRRSDLDGTEASGVRSSLDLVIRRRPVNRGRRSRRGRAGCGHAAGIVVRGGSQRRQGLLRLVDALGSALQVGGRPCCG